MKFLLNHAHLIVDGNREYIDGALLINNETIEDVFYNANKVNIDLSEYEVIDCSGNVIMPGFFDTHTHGINGLSFDEVDTKGMDDISREFAKDGTTSFLASLSYDCPVDQYEERFKVMNDYDAPMSRFEGIHMEGPFLSTKHLGIGDPDKFLKPNKQMVEDILNKCNCLKQMTIACEIDGYKEVGELLHEHSVKVMCGHSDACLENLDDNVDGFTHLFNAMRGLHHRDVTLVNCSFMNKWMCELIADGNHVDRNVLRLVINNIDRDKIMLVSDSSTARNLPDGEYDFMSKHCTKKGTKFISSDGHYAGSVVSINDEMKVLYELGVKYTDLLLYSSLNAFKFYGLDKHFGSLVKGKSSDCVIMDENLNVINVLIRGKLIYD